KASEIAGAAVLSALTPGPRSRTSCVVLARNTRWNGNVRMAVLSAGGPLEIESWMNGRATSASAEKVVSRFTKRSAWDWATGAVVEAARSSAGNRLFRRLAGFDRFWATGIRLASRTGANWMASLRLWPRPASALPNSVRFVELATRVG